MRIQCLVKTFVLCRSDTGYNSSIVDGRAVAVKLFHLLSSERRARLLFVLDEGIGFEPMTFRL